MSDLNNPHTQGPYSPACQILRWHAAQLPVSQHMPQLERTIRSNAVTILVGETGSGKSTQLPKYILESMSDAVNGDICLTQPRKLAAESVSLMITITSSNDIH
jgi:HrpA-like RNA helicase